MLEVSEHELKKKLLKDYYKLKTELAKAKDEKTKLKIINDIYSINTFLENTLIVYDDEYGYDEFYPKNFKYFRKCEQLENEEIKRNIELLRKNNDIFQKIFVSVKEIIKKQENIKHDLSRSTEISPKMFYNLLFNFPMNEFNNYLIFQLKGKSMFIENDRFLYETKQCFGAHYNIVHLNKDYYFVETYNKYSYLTILSIIHEISHSYIERKYNYLTTLNVFREVMSYYMEFKTMDYFYNKNIGNLDIVTNFNSILNGLKLSLIGGFNISNNEEYTYFMYLIGPLVAFMFYELDKSDSEMCNYYMDYFHKNLKTLEPFELLIKSNIDIEQLTSGETVKRMIKQYNDYCAKTELKN